MSKMERPACITHRCEMVCQKNGYRVQIDTNSGPYMVYAGDLYRCPVGGEEIVTKWANEALAYAHEKNFSEYQETAQSVLAVQ